MVEENGNRPDVVTVEALYARVKVAAILARVDALTDEGLLPNGQSVAEFVDGSGAVNLPSLSNLLVVCAGGGIAEQAKQRVEDFYLSQVLKEPHWSRRASEAQGKGPNGRMSTRLPERQTRGPGRHSNR